MKFDKYEIIARLFPAIICITPIFALGWFFPSLEVLNFFEKVYAIKMVANISISAIFVFLLAQSNRLVSKEVFEKKFFDNGLSFPTTELLLHSDNTFSKEFKKKIYNRISENFGLSLSSEKEEKDNTITARKKVNEAVSFIRKKVGNGILLFQHNIEYGFFRNLVGGSATACALSLINIIIFSTLSYNIVALKISCITFIIYFIPVIFSRKIIFTSGKYYAKVLIEEYMSIK